MPKVSVIIPVHNREDFLEEAVQSVLVQTHTNFELIIVNDASTDQTAAVAARLADTDARVRVLHHAENKYRSGALNTGIEHAQGVYVSILDSDDYYLPDKLERQVAFLEQNASVDVVYGDFEILRKTAVPLLFTEALASTENVRERLVAAAAGGSTAVMPDGYIPSCSALIRSHVFTHLRFDPTLRNAEDLDMWLQIIGAGFTFRKLPGSTYVYRTHENQKSKNSVRMKYAMDIIYGKIRAGTYLTATNQK